MQTDGVAEADGLTHQPFNEDRVPRTRARLSGEAGSFAATTVEGHLNCERCHGSGLEGSLSASRAGRVAGPGDDNIADSS